MDTVTWDDGTTQQVNLSTEERIIASPHIVTAKEHKKTNWWMVLAVVDALIIIDIWFNSAKVILWLYFLLTGGF